MKDFNYHSAKDSKEASKLASSSSAFLAGGMTTIPSMKLGLATYKDLIDITYYCNIDIWVHRASLRACGAYFAGPLHAHRAFWELNKSMKYNINLYGKPCN